MFARLRILLSPLLALALIGGMGWLLFLGIQTVWRALVSVNPQLAVAVVAAATTLIASTATVMLGRYFERKKEIEAHFRAEKIKIYDEFLAELFKVFQSGGEATDGMVAFLREWQRKLVLWGGSNVLSAYFKWMNRLKSAPDAQTLFLRLCSRKLWLRMPSHGQNEPRDCLQAIGRFPVQSPEPAQIIFEVARGHSVELSNPGLQTAMVGIDVLHLSLIHI